jgi:hypothetical protein
MVFSWNIFLTTAVAMLLYGAFFGIVVPHMEQVYRAFQVRLPRPAQIILQLGRLLVPWGGIVLAGIPLILAVLVPLMLPSPSSSSPDGAVRAHRWAARAVRLLLLGLLLAMMLALMTPMYSLIDALTSPRMK